MKLFLLISSLCLLAAGAIPNEDPSPVVDYRFSCDVKGRPQVDSSGSSFLGDLVGLNSTHCNYVNNGVSSSTIAESNSTIALMRQYFLATNASGLAVELWITPAVGHDLSVWNPILMIGDNHYQDDDDADDYDDCRNTFLSLGLRGNLLEIRYVNNDPQQPCQTLLVRQQPLGNNELVQILLTLNQGETSVYFNGEPTIVKVPNEFMTNLTMWNPDGTLQLFSNQIVSNSHSDTGSLHQVSIYDHHFSADQIQWAYQQELQGKQEALFGLDPLHLVAFADPVTVVQGRPSPLDVGGLNRSTAAYSVQLEITSLPRFGHILGDDGPITDVGTRIPLPVTWKTTSLFYRSWSDDFFSSPEFSYSGEDLHLTPEVFEYRLVALDRNDGALLGWSDAVQKEITIRHVNHPPTLVLPKMVTVPTDKPTDVAAGPIAVIEGVHLDDPDRNIDRVRVDIWTLNGTLAIQNYLDLADFGARTIPSRPTWQCHGNPNGSSNMTFLAEPYSVSLILSSLQYEGHHWNQEDSIVIRIYDGSGGPCLEEEEHKYNSIHDACFEIVATMTVPAIAQSPEIFEITNVWLLLLVLLMASGFVIQCSQKCIKKFSNRGSASQGWEKETDLIPEEDIVEMV